MKLTLSDTDHLNATYTQENGTSLYQVVTPSGHGQRDMVAAIRKAVPESDQGTSADRYASLAQVEFHVLVPSVFRIDGKELKTTVFFKNGGPTAESLGSSRKFVGPDGKEYKWILGEKAPSLVLNDDPRIVVAKFQEKQHRIFSKSRLAFLEISSVGMHMVDLIFVTFVYIETLRKEKETARQTAHGSAGL
ncbi:hypothetical protein BDN72DRAFT_846505 [Pluteus cervinus]|uniref:Uncharacterized protein n=1 Tax=Pluteus cervinus TaxID=181527 RepID=A0ACD3AGV3_9AGAR|nr:hypothetical protein BDN72DRAFT_846505 [Pluteus cervinus]